ncbi:spectrin alpha chain, partial [Plakobranchus ocellatus]
MTATLSYDILPFCINVSRYTEHSTVGLAQQWDQLDQLCMRMQHNLEQQIEARNRSGVSEDALREFSMMF